MRDNKVQKWNETAELLGRDVGPNIASRKGMGRVARKLLVDWDSTHHCMFRSHNGMDLFGDDKIANHFLNLLGQYKSKYGILIHSYCLMSTHPHVVLSTTRGQKEFSAFWQVVNCRLAKFANRILGKRGQVVMERLRSPRIQPDNRHMLTVMRYGDLNPVRAGKVRSPNDHKHSSYRHYAFGEKNLLIDDAPDYLALGSSPKARRIAYQMLFSTAMKKPLLCKRPDLTAPYAIGEDSWVIKLAKAWGLFSQPPA